MKENILERIIEPARSDYKMQGYTEAEIQILVENASLILILLSLKEAPLMTKLFPESLHLAGRLLTIWQEENKTK